MSEDRTIDLNKMDNREEGRAVTSDAKNTPSAYAGVTRARVSTDTKDISFDIEDDILDVIRRRKEKSEAAESPAPISQDVDQDLFKDDDIDTMLEEFIADDAAAPEEPDYKRTIVMQESQDAVSDETREFEPDCGDSSDRSLRDTIDLGTADSTSDAAQIDVVQSSETAESEEAETQAETDAAQKIEETPEQEASGKDESQQAPEEEEMSPLEKELQKDFANNPNVLSDRRTLKKYGFKPYTRELKADEMEMLREAREAQDFNAGYTGSIRKMSKGSAKNTKKNSATGKTRTSMVDKKARTAKKNPSGGQYAAATGGGGSKSGKGNKGKKKKQQKKWVGFIRAFVRTIIICLILAVLAGAGYTANVISHADTIHPKNIYDTLDVSTHIYDDQENLVDEIYYSENRQIVSYEQLPENLKNAFIAVEDKTFWTHKGFNFRRIIGAILERFHGGRISGTSTITQQLARNIFLPEDKSVRSIKRKIIEMYYAYEIEQELSKEEILTAYLNTIYLGYGCYGVDTAAKTYFGTEVENLTLEQCAALAALPQAPGSYALLTTEPTDKSVEYKNGIYINDTSEDRRNMILNMMLQQGLITQEEKDAAVRPLEEFINPGSTDSATSQSAFKDYLIEAVKKDLMNEYGIEEDQAIKIIYTKGLNIYTTMDSQAQEVITEQFKKKKNFPSAVKSDANVESAMVVTEVGTGEIKAMVGTRNASGQMLFNRATNPRQPGSSIKPISVYAPALQKSLEYQKEGKIFKFKNTGYDKQGIRDWGDYITVSSKVIDEKMTVNGQTWPLNVTRTYSGYNTFRTAIQQSINTCAVKILAQVGLEYSMDTVKRFGITTVVDDTSQPINDLNLAALGLGAMSYGISPLEMSAAYAVFPNGGVYNSPIIYTKVEDSSGRTLLESKSETVKVLDEGVAWIMVDVLKSVVTRGIAKDAAVDGIQVGGKTGTTDDRYDIWFNGFTPSYAVALWIGTDDNVQMDSASEKAAALWSKVVSRIDRAKEGSYKSIPQNVIRAWDGEYYTRGTEPEEPEPEPEEDEEGEEGKDKDAKEGDKAPAAEKIDAKPEG